MKYYMEMTIEYNIENLPAEDNENVTLCRN